MKKNLRIGGVALGVGGLILSLLATGATDEDLVRMIAMGITILGGVGVFLSFFVREMPTR